MPSQTIVPPTVLPVFVLEKWVPEGTSVYDICLASEKSSGAGTIDGATCISGLWRIYPLTPTARVSLLTKGIVMGNKTILLESINPFVLKNGVNESQGTRLTISNLPFSYSNEAVARNLVSAGFKLRSQILFEKTRGPDKLLTDWKNGRRYCWITLPTQEVKRNLKMGSFTAFLYFREMKNNMVCRKCLQQGHRAVDCPNEEVCLSCKLPGHRRGSSECGLTEVRDRNRSDSEDDYNILWGQRRRIDQSEHGDEGENERTNVIDGNAKVNDTEGDKGEKETTDLTSATEKVNERADEDELYEELSLDSEVSRPRDIHPQASREDTSTLEADEDVVRTTIPDEESVQEVSEEIVESQEKVMDAQVDNLQKTEESIPNSKGRKEIINPSNDLEEGEIQEEDVSGIMSNEQGAKAKGSRLIGQNSDRDEGRNQSNKTYKGNTTKSLVRDGSDTPTHRGMVQSILKFVSSGKRGSDIISPEGSVSAKPCPKRLDTKDKAL